MIFLKKFFVTILFSFQAFATVDLSQLPAPYNTLTTLLLETDDGSYSNAREMQRLMKGRSIHTVIEIGSSLGVSTKYIACLISDDGKVYAVDRWQGPGLYKQFLSNVVHAHLEHKIIPMRMANPDAAQVLIDVEPDLIYLEKSHEAEEVYQDLVTWFPYVENKKGIVSGNGWSLESVRIAVDQFAREHHLVIHAANNFWWVEKL